MANQNFIVYKPYGYLSQFVYELKRNKKLLGELYDFPKNTMAIGRLDEDSEGLLLLTTNGMISEIVRSKKVEKEYYVQVDGIITEQAIEELKSGVLIGLNGTKYLTKKCEAKILIEIPKLPERSKKIRDERHGPTSWLSIILTEGKFRQVRKMVLALKHRCMRLVRLSISNILLADLAPGKVKELKEKEFYQLLQHSKKVPFN